MLNRGGKAMKFEEISFIEAMHMIDCGNMEKVYYLLGGQLCPIKMYKSDFDQLNKHTYFIFTKKK